VTLKYWFLVQDYTADDHDVEEEDCVVELRDQVEFDDWARKSKATLWLKCESDWPTHLKLVRQLRSLAEAVQAQEDATATGTYLFMEHPTDLTRQLSDGTRCHWTEGSSKESLEHRMGWNILWLASSSEWGVSRG